MRLIRGAEGGSVGERAVLVYVVRETAPFHGDRRRRDPPTLAPIVVADVDGGPVLLDSRDGGDHASRPSRVAHGDGSRGFGAPADARVAPKTEVKGPGGSPPVRIEANRQPRCSRSVNEAGHRRAESFSTNTPSRPACAGDCNREDSSVAINEAPWSASTSPSGLQPVTQCGVLRLAIRRANPQRREPTNL
jgi:hypothetical protein